MRSLRSRVLRSREHDADAPGSTTIRVKAHPTGRHSAVLAAVAIALLAVLLAGLWWRTTRHPDLAGRWAGGGYADTTYYVSQTAEGAYRSISAAYSALLAKTGGDLIGKGHHIIQVQDSETYDESVYITGLKTTAADTLTIRKDPNLSGRPTLFPSTAGARPLKIHDVAYVMVSGFVFKNIATAQDAMLGAGADQSDLTTTLGQVIWDNCLIDGQNQNYSFKAILFFWNPNCNITVRNCEFTGCDNRGNASFVYLGKRSIAGPTPEFVFANNSVHDNPALSSVQMEGDPAKGRYHWITIANNHFAANTGLDFLVNLHNQNAGNTIQITSLSKITLATGRFCFPTLATLLSPTTI